MTLSEFWYKWGWLIISPIVAMVIVIWAQFSEIKQLRDKQPECKSCNCLTMKEILFHLEKREMFVDKLQQVNRKQRGAIIDSINFHNSILDSTGNAIEY